MQNFLYSKGGLILSYIARDCLVSEVGDSLPTINTYTTTFSASRGIVQDAIAKLQQIGAISTTNRGVHGTELTNISPEKLLPFTNWNTLTLSMPLPLNQYLSSLTTAVNFSFSTLPMATAFAYTSGSSRRLGLLQKNSFDIIIVPLNSAKKFIEQDPEINPPIVLSGGQYSAPFAVFSRFPDGKIADNVRVMRDMSSFDHWYLTQKIFAGRNVDYVDMPYLGFGSIADDNLADIVVCRQEAWVPYILSHGFYQFPISDYLEDYISTESTIPALLTYSKNYRINELILKHFDVNKVVDLQKRIINNEISDEFKRTHFM